MNKKDIASKKKYRCLYEAKREQYVEYLKNHLWRYSSPGMSRQDGKCGCEGVSGKYCVSRHTPISGVGAR